MKSAILAVGTELLLGQVTNTNAAYLSQELNNLGIDVIYHYTMGDNPERLKRVLAFAMEDCDLILFTGGLGPTEDDLTKETIADAIGAKLVLNKEALDSMQTFFERMHMNMTDNNVKQAYLPEHSTVFQNGAGTAPGFATENHGQFIIALPGVPREMKHMFERSVRPFLQNLSRDFICSRSIRTFGLGESLVETELLSLIEAQTDPTIATYAKEGVVEIRVTSKRKTEEEARRAADAMVEDVRQILKGYVFSVDGLEIYEEVGRKLLERNITVSVCEAPTAGLFAGNLVRVPGISAVFDRGLITYSDGSKIEELNLRPDLFEVYSPFSKKGVEHMVKGLRAKTGSRLCIVCTGMAGPETRGNVSSGLYYISVLFDGVLHTRSFLHNGRTRQLNREYMTLTMFAMVNHILEGTEMPELESAL